ncbi:MAG: hypothetical protein B6D37_07280 [Sphingobacteriales bacterium UTBCD1]|nr:MAG: hypothetical protein B6D37_07280 [Sphingobacteriales bacterium UTBCD1]
MRTLRAPLRSLRLIFSYRKENKEYFAASAVKLFFPQRAQSFSQRTQRLLCELCGYIFFTEKDTEKNIEVLIPNWATAMFFGNIVYTSLLVCSIPALASA